MAKKTTTDHAKKFMEEMYVLAEKLYSVRSDLNTREERFKKETDDLYVSESSLKLELMDRLKAIGLNSVKVSNGDAWYISKKPSVNVLNEPQFNHWALERQLAKPDLNMVKAKLKSIIEAGGELPPGVELVERETISIRKKEIKEKLNGTKKMFRV